MKDFLVKYGKLWGNKIYPSVEEIRIHNPDCLTIEPVESDEEKVTITEDGLVKKKLALYNVYKCYEHCTNYYVMVRYVRYEKADDGMGTVGP